MKKIVILSMLALSLIISAQNIEKKCKSCGKVLSSCSFHGRHPSSSLSQANSGTRLNNQLNSKPDMFLNIKGEDSDVGLNLDYRRELWVDVHCSEGDYSIAHTPQWCVITDKKKNGFSIRAIHPNRSLEDLRGVIKIEGAGKVKFVRVVQEGELVAQINRVSDSISDKRIIINIDFDLKKVKDNLNDWRKQGYLLQVDFYDSNDNPLKAKDAEKYYRNSEGQVSVRDHVISCNENDETAHVHRQLSIPLSKLNLVYLTNFGEFLIKYKVILYDVNSRKDVVCSDLKSIKLFFEFSINGKNNSVLNSIYNFDSGGGSKHFEVNSSIGYAFDSIPDWCTIENFNDKGFDIRCTPYYAVESDAGRSGEIVVCSGNRRISLFVNQTTYWMERIRRKKR